MQPSALLARYQTVRATTEALAAPLSREDCQVQSMDDASPVKWHLAHTSWFFETFVLERAGNSYEHFHPRFRTLFNSYYQSVGAQHPRPQRGLLTRPTLDEVHAYRRHVDTHVLDWLSTSTPDATLNSVLETGLHHEQQHQELILTDVKHLLVQNPLSWRLCRGVRNHQQRTSARAALAHVRGRHPGGRAPAERTSPSTTSARATAP